MITCTFGHKLTEKNWGEKCPYCIIKELEEQLKAVKLITDKLSETYALNRRERICDTDIAFYVAQLRAALQDKGVQE